MRKGFALTVPTGIYAVHAATDDRVTHKAQLSVGSYDDIVLHFRCRRLLIDKHGGALSHLRRPENLVDCMTCLAAERVG